MAARSPPGEAGRASQRDGVGEDARESNNPTAKTPGQTRVSTKPSAIQVRCHRRDWPIPNRTIRRGTRACYRYVPCSCEHEKLVACETARTPQPR